MWVWRDSDDVLQAPAPTDREETKTGRDHRFVIDHYPVVGRSLRRLLDAEADLE